MRRNTFRTIATISKRSGRFYLRQKVRTAKQFVETLLILFIATVLFVSFHFFCSVVFLFHFSFLLIIVAKLCSPVPWQQMRDVEVTAYSRQK